MPGKVLNAATALADLTAAWSAPSTPARASGCGRVYVDLSLPDRASKTAVAKAAKALGLIYGANYYSGSKTSLYVGYDNCDGRALGKGPVIAAALKALGWSAYDGAYGD